MQTHFFVHGKKIKTEEDYKTLKVNEEIEIDDVKYIVDFIFDDRCYDVFEVELVLKK